MPQFIKPKTNNMKKVFAILALAGVMASCNNKKKEETKSADDTTIVKDNMGDQTTTTNIEGVPTFSDPEIQQYVNDLTAFVNTYIGAIKGKDMAKAAELAPKWTDWSTRSVGISQKLAANPEDAKKWADYWTKLSNDWAEAAQTMMPNQ